MNFTIVIADIAILLNKGYVPADDDTKRITSDSKPAAEHSLEVPK